MFPPSHLSHSFFSIHPAYPLFYTSSSICLFSSADAAGQSDKDILGAGFYSSPCVRVCLWVSVRVHPYLVYFVCLSLLIWSMKVMYLTSLCFERPVINGFIINTQSFFAFLSGGDNYGSVCKCNEKFPDQFWTSWTCDNVRASWGRKRSKSALI